MTVSFKGDHCPRRSFHDLSVGQHVQSHASGGVPPPPAVGVGQLAADGLPETLTIDGSEANEAAIESYNAEHGTAIVIQQVQYFNNIVEQDHRTGKRIPRPM